MQRAQGIIIKHSTALQGAQLDAKAVNIKSHALAESRIIRIWRASLACLVINAGLQSMGADAQGQLCHAGTGPAASRT